MNIVSKFPIKFNGSIKFSVTNFLEEVIIKNNLFTKVEKFVTTMMITVDKFIIRRLSKISVNLISTWFLSDWPVSDEQHIVFM